MAASSPMDLAAAAPKSDSITKATRILRAFVEINFTVTSLRRLLDP